MADTFRAAQIPLLALLLLLACAGKAGRALRARSVAQAFGPTVMFPLRLRRPAAVAVCVTELCLGVALLVTAGRLLSWPWVATAVRLGVTLFFVTATGALAELRAHHPTAGCGCFGELSAAPVSYRTIARSALFTVAAAATVGVPPGHLAGRGLLPGPPHGTAQAQILAGLVLAEVALIGLLSPELGEALMRLGYRAPCELRRVPLERTLRSLLASRAWRRHAPLLTSAEPADTWREMCWRFAVFPGEAGGRAVDVVFAVHARRLRPPVRAVVVDALTGEVVSRDGRACPPPRPVPGTAGAPDHAPGQLTPGGDPSPVPVGVSKDL